MSIKSQANTSASSKSKPADKDSSKTVSATTTASSKTAAAGTPNPDYDGKVTKEETDELERLRLAYVKAKETNSPDLADARNAYFDCANKLLIDLSGKLDPSDIPQKPAEGVPKQGGNQDPDVWTVNQMRDDPTKYKVIDDASKNIATDFSSMESAQLYIAYYRWKKQQGDDVPVPPDGGGGGNGQASQDVDQFGIRMICPSVKGGYVGTDFKLEEKMRNYASGKPSEWSTEYTNVSSETIQNQEVTIYEMINGFKKAPDTISLKQGGPPHTDGARFWVIPDFGTDGSPKRTLEIEDPHPHNHPVNPKPLFEIGTSIVGKWIGYKGISYQTKDGARHVESWIHFPVANIDDVKSEQANWRKYMEYTCDKKYKTFLGKLTTSRLDGVTKGDPPTFKYSSVREISPPA